MKGRLLSAFLALAVAAPALSLSAAASAWEDPASGSREMWEGRFRKAHGEVVHAQQRLREATRAYREMRHRHRVRGEEKQRVIDERAEAKAALEDAESRRDQLFEEARRAGVPPGWMRAWRSDAAAAPEPADEP